MCDLLRTFTSGYSHSMRVVGWTFCPPDYRYGGKQQCADSQLPECSRRSGPLRCIGGMVKNLPRSVGVPVGYVRRSLGNRLDVPPLAESLGKRATGRPLWALPVRKRTTLSSTRGKQQARAITPSVHMRADMDDDSLTGSVLGLEHTLQDFDQSALEKSTSL